MKPRTIFIVCVALFAAGCGRLRKDDVEASTLPPRAVEPDPAKIPAGPVGDSIRRGRLLFLETARYAPQFVGSKLSCNDCHLGGGTASFAAPMVGMPGLFPMYNKRANKVISLEDRVQECFTRSENGRPIDYHGAEMLALVSYIHWVSNDQTEGKAFPGRGLVKLPELESDAKRGEKIYGDNCAPCHGKDGAGQPPILPALWGPDSYNDGAGMNQIPKMAAFVQHNMPQNHPGSLTAQQAYDVAAFVHTKPRPKFNAEYSIY